MSDKFKHTVRICKHFERTFRLLDKDVRDRVLNKVAELANDEARGKALRGPLRNFYTIRVGRYRIIYRAPKPCEIELYTVEHREVVYERLTSRH